MGNVPTTEEGQRSDQQYQGNAGIPRRYGKLDYIQYR